MDDTAPADYADDTALIPVLLEVSSAATQARPLPSSGPGGLEGWARADAIAVVPPGAGMRGDVSSNSWIPSGATDGRPPPEPDVRLSLLSLPV